MRVDDICRRHCVRVLEHDEVEPGDEPYYSLRWEYCVEECYEIANAVMLGLGKAIAEICEDAYKSYDPEDSYTRFWALKCVKWYLSELSYWRDLVADIIDRMFTRYEIVFRALWEHPGVRRSERER